jgi:hypothetical protein
MLFQLRLLKSEQEQSQVIPLARQLTMNCGKKVLCIRFKIRKKRGL